MQYIDSLFLQKLFNKVIWDKCKIFTLTYTLKT